MNLFLDALAWLTDPTHWSGSGGIPTRLGQHLLLCGIVLLSSAIIAIPVGIFIGHSGRGKNLVVSFTGAVRAIPTLGLLTVLALWLGIGVQAPILALIVLAIPSILAGTYAGIESVDRRTVDAAQATGMTQFQVITRVELPLAAPVLIGGIRAAMLQIIATATLAAYVADAGLGRYLFAGLKSNDYPQMLGGAILVAALAIIFEAIFAMLQHLSTRITDPAHGTRAPASSKGIR